MSECIFCEIAAGRLPARIIHETDDLVAFHDLNPQAPTHILIVSKKHIPGLTACAGEDEALLGKIQLAAAEIARKLSLEQSCRLVTNNGKAAGQSVSHLHYHLLGGRKMNWPPG